MVMCLERGAGCLHMVQLMPVPSQSPIISCHLTRDWFYLSGQGLPRLFWKRGCYTGVAVVIVVVVELGGHASP